MPWNSTICFLWQWDHETDPIDIYFCLMLAAILPLAKDLAPDLAPPVVLNVPISMLTIKVSTDPSPATPCTEPGIQQFHNYVRRGEFTNPLLQASILKTAALLGNNAKQDSCQTDPYSFEPSNDIGYVHQDNHNQRFCQLGACG